MEYNDHQKRDYFDQFLDIYLIRQILTFYIRLHILYI